MRVGFCTPVQQLLLQQGEHGSKGLYGYPLDVHIAFYTRPEAKNGIFIPHGHTVYSLLPRTIKSMDVTLKEQITMQF